ncbi:hypothetical protein Vafri_14240 [Volvox africanus]|uniref:Uncharacterized protein n=1 Tax=Volvox africanus TaxID=51714 RepID=A0A8J4F4G8_9CHLO|nr:hypothetical protein Vafri_14240 [Volvox africanus]
MISLLGKLGFEPKDRGYERIDTISNSNSTVNDNDSVMSNSSCIDGNPVGQPAGRVVVSHLRDIMKKFGRKWIPTEKPLQRFGKLEGEESLTLQERLCARRVQITEKGTLLKALLSWKGAPENLHQAGAQPEAEPVPAAQQEPQLESEENNVQQCAGGVTAPSGLAGAAEAIELAYQRLDETTEAEVFKGFQLQVSDLIAQLEKLRSGAAMMEARKGAPCGGASTDPQGSSTTANIAILPTASCPATGATSLPPVVEAAAADDDAADASISIDTAAQRTPELYPPVELIMQPPMHPKTPERRLPPEARHWGLQDGRSWAGDQQWSSWAEVQAFTKTLEPTLAEAIREGSLEHNPLVAFGKEQAAAPAISFVQLKLLELCGSRKWGTASIQSPSLEGPRKRRPFLAAFLRAAKGITEPCVQRGGIRL